MSNYTIADGHRLSVKGTEYGPGDTVDLDDDQAKSLRDAGVLADNQRSNTESSTERSGGESPAQSEDADTSRRRVRDR